MSEPIRTYRDFWPYYLGEHSKPATRLCHIAGTFVASVLLVIGIPSANAGLIAAAVVAGYLPAWVAHFAIEGNRPATFRYPFWSLISDFRMVGLWLTGGLEAELTKGGVPTGWSQRT
jgi:hypothetical protein